MLPDSMSSTARRRLVVVGNGMVGQRLLDTLVAENHHFDITVLCEEPRAAYDRVQLTSFFSGKSAEDLVARACRFLHSTWHRHPLLADDRCHRSSDEARDDVVRRTLRLRPLGAGDGLEPVRAADPWARPHELLRLPHDRGPARPSIAPRAARRSAQSLAAVCSGSKPPKRSRTSACRRMSSNSRRDSWPCRLTSTAAASCGRRSPSWESGSIPARALQLLSMANRRRIACSSPTALQLDTDLIVFSAGIRPRDELARQAGLAVGERGGIVIDDHCVTSDPDIFAIGECAVWNGKLYGLVAPGYRMAAVCAAWLLGRDEPTFAGADMSTKLKLMGVDVASLGDAHCMSSDARAYTFIDERRQIYKKLVIDAAGTRVLGGILIGDADDYGIWLQMLLDGTRLPDDPAELVVPACASELKPAGKGSAALPATAQICSCNNVSKGAICAAIDAGCTTLGALKTSTKAATSCGGCSSLLAQVLKAELAARGVATSNHLCEHFAYSRQQLFHLIRVGQLRSFADTLVRHGRGLGCDICKPVIASILASCWNEFVLKREQAVLQDTNDYFLANLQKDGTYSVVPRVPGGEITPDKLITIGAVAKKYGLYTKITGGQRIDLFGAQVHQLPLIWKELIEAGFESGHAYGKAVRTVKSCVGSTWCRYGVQDSVGYAIDLENRYKGLRAPHKLKFAVSGCARECAEAQSKDVGIIATEKGWNLYVCGNGGMKPRHADLLASDLDGPTLIRYVDRFLMFYIRTADRLQRTSVWLDHLEGGLDYLRQVVIEDKLGIAAELETDMARVIDSYQCEWRKAINDPQTLKRFRHFVNSDRADDNVVFIEERGQIRPASRSERHKEAT